MPYQKYNGSCLDEKNKFLQRILLLFANQLNNNINKNLGAREVAQKLKAYIAFEENLHLVHRALLYSSPV